MESFDANCEEGRETGECPLLYERCPDRHICELYQDTMGFLEETEKGEDDV
jgi:hypothetical protein